MKKLVFLFVTALLCISCSDNDTVIVDVTEADIVGSWNVIEYTNESSASYNYNGIPFTSTSSAYGKDFDSVLTFSETLMLLPLKEALQPLRLLM